MRLANFCQEVSCHLWSCCWHQSRISCCMVVCPVWPHMSRRSSSHVYMLEESARARALLWQLSAQRGSESGQRTFWWRVLAFSYNGEHI